MTFSGFKSTRFPLINLLLLIIPLMFLITIVMNFNLLSKTDECNCPNQQYEKIVISMPKSKLVSVKHRLAVLVPFRERFEELLQFIPYISNFLNKQNLDYNIFILNQVDNYRFNRASLLNAGFSEIRNSYDYIAMHDVDLLPLNADLSYAYPKLPVHLAAPELHPRYHYAKFIGGILLINRDHFELVNGLSNRYWGWGLEDDEFYVRLKDAHLNITRPENILTGKNNTFKHIHGKERKRDTVKCYNQREVTRRRDRQTGLHDVKYKIVSYNDMKIDEAPFIVINIDLSCNKTTTPWCECISSTTDKVSLKTSSS